VLAVVVLIVGVLAGLAVAGTHLRRTKPKAATASTKPVKTKHRKSGPGGPATHRSVLSPKDTYAYWTRERMRGARPPQTGVPGGTPPPAPASGGGGAAPGSAPTSP